MLHPANILLLALSLILFPAKGRQKSSAPQQKKAAGQKSTGHGKQQKGMATFYSKRSTGARTASGARLHHDSLVCAHRTHPFGTRLKVTNPRNGKSVIVKVIDRGPFRRGGIIDLSWRAAKEIDMISQGVAMVIVNVVKDEIHSPYKLREQTDSIEFDIETNDFYDGTVPVWQNSNISEAIFKRGQTQHKQ